jgi:hypothetical protein
MEELIKEVVEIATDLFNNQNISPAAEHLSREKCFEIAVGIQRNWILKWHSNG